MPEAAAIPKQPVADELITSEVLARVGTNPIAFSGADNPSAAWRLMLSDTPGAFPLYRDLEEKDGQISSALETRKEGVLRRERKLVAASGTAADERRAAFAREVLAAIPNFENILYELLDAAGYGFTVAEILWEQDGSIDLASAIIASAALKLANSHIIRWGSSADFSFDASKFTFNKGGQFISASASTLPLWIRHAASPTSDYFLVQNSTPATIFSIDDSPDGRVEITPGAGTGLFLDPTISALGAQGANTNIVLDLLSKGTGTVRVNARNSSGTGGFAVYDGAASPKLMFSVTNTGVGNNGAGFKHGRVTTGSVGAGASAAVTLTWGTAFADTNYTATCSVVETTASTSTLRLHHLESVATTGVTVRVVNDDGGAAHTGTLHCTAVHD